MQGLETILRPAAIVPTAAATRIVAELGRNDVARGGVWNATSSIWQLYDRPWDGVCGTHGDAQLLGTVAVVYDQPRRHEITIFKVSITNAGLTAGLTTDALCDAALQYAELSLATCPRSEMLLPPQVDPFHGEVDLGAVPVPEPVAVEPEPEPAPAVRPVAAVVAAVAAASGAPEEKRFFEKVDVGELLRLRVQKLAEVRHLGETG